MKFYMTIQNVLNRAQLWRSNKVTWNSLEIQLVIEDHLAGRVILNVIKTRTESHFKVKIKWQPKIVVLNIDLYFQFYY